MVMKDSGWGQEGGHLIVVLRMKFSRTPWRQQVREGINKLGKPAEEPRLVDVSCVS